ncbi:MAG TPA: tetratricopeptide repeat protein, partial [Terriglobales bacterium]|nr:tetratricopeptide repeat protein [Terriglobales bacterium]
MKFRFKNHATILSLLAILVLFGACSRDPKARRDKFLLSAQRYYDKGQYEAASIELRRAIQLDPKFAEAHYRLAQTYVNMRDWQRGYDELQISLQINPADVRSRLALAELQWLAKQPVEARTQVEIALQSQPNNITAHLLLGQIYTSEKNYLKALEEFEASERLAPNQAVAFAKAGETYMLLRRYSEAQQSFQRAIDLDASYITAYLNLAETYRFANDSQNEIQILLTAIARNPKQVAPYLAAARAYARTEHPESIRSLFSQLRSANGADSSSLLAIGDFYFSMGDALEGKTVLREALSKDGKNSAIRKHLIELELNQHDWDEAEKLNADLLKADPRDPMARLFQARLQFARGAKSSAVT